MDGFKADTPAATPGTESHRHDDGHRSMRGHYHGDDGDRVPPEFNSVTSLGKIHHEAGVTSSSHSQQHAVSDGNSEQDPNSTRNRSGGAAAAGAAMSEPGPPRLQSITMPGGARRTDSMESKPLLGRTALAGGGRGGEGIVIHESESPLAALHSSDSNDHPMSHAPSPPPTRSTSSRGGAAVRSSSTSASLAGPTPLDGQKTPCDDQYGDRNASPSTSTRHSGSPCGGSSSGPGLSGVGAWFRRLCKCRPKEGSTPLTGRSATGNEDEGSGVRRTLGVWKFTFLAYFLVCGGPFGMEVAVSSGGPLYTFIGFLVLPIVWSIPQALMTAEMSSMMPQGGGYVLWSQVAFGDFAGWITGVNGILSSLFDLALYPALFADYFKQQIDVSDVELYMVRVLVALFCLTLNLRGLDAVAWMLAAMTALVLLPFFIYFFYELKSIFSAGPHFTKTLGDPDWGLFLSTMMWSYTGWDSLGCIAGEVNDPARTYIRGTLATVMLVTVSYALPVFCSIQLHPDFEVWEDGDFVTFLEDIAKPIGVWASVASMMANLGMYNAELSANSRAVWALAGGDDSSIMPCRHIPAAFSSIWKRYGTPVGSLVAHTVIVLGLNFFDFEALVEADMLLTGLRLYVEFAAFLWLRYKWPRTPRAFKVPGGWWGAWAVTLPKLGLITALCVTATKLTWYMALVVNSLGVIIFIIRKKYTNTYEYDHDLFEFGPGVRYPGPSGSATPTAGQGSGVHIVTEEEAAAAEQSEGLLASELELQVEVGRLGLDDHPSDASGSRPARGFHPASPGGLHRAGGSDSASDSGASSDSGSSDNTRRVEN